MFKTFMQNNPEPVFFEAEPHVNRAGFDFLILRPPPPKLHWRPHSCYDQRTHVHIHPCSWASIPQRELLGRGTDAPSFGWGTAHSLSISFTVLCSSQRASEFPELSIFCQHFCITVNSLGEYGIICLTFLIICERKVFTFLNCVCVHTCMFMSQIHVVEIREQLSGVSPLFSHCGSQRSYPGFQLWQQGPLPAEPSRQPSCRTFYEVVMKEIIYMS